MYKQIVVCFLLFANNLYGQSTLWSNPPVAAWEGTRSRIPGCWDLIPIGHKNSTTIADDNVEVWLRNGSYLVGIDSRNRFNPKNDFGICAWIRMGHDDPKNISSAIAHYDTLSNNRAFCLYFTKDQAVFALSTNGSLGTLLTVPFTKIKSQRICLMADYQSESGLMRLSINGSDWHSTILPGGGRIHAYNGPIQLGSFYGLKSQMNCGGVLPAMIYHRRFTDQEKQDWYNNGFPLSFQEEPAKRQNLIVCCGDSITWGCSAKQKDWLGRNDNPWPLACNNVLGKDFSFDNVACRGNTAYEMVSLIDHFVINRDCKVAIFMLGINDIRKRDSSSEEIIACLDHIAKKCVHAKIKPIFLTLTPFKKDRLHPWTPEKQKVLEEVNYWILNNGYPCADSYSATVDVDGLSLKEEYDSGDGIHPTSEYGDAIAGVLVPVIRNQMKFFLSE